MNVARRSMTYPFLEAQGMQLKNLNKAIAAYLPKSSGVKKIKIDSKPVLKALREWLKVSPNPDFVLR